MTITSHEMVWTNCTSDRTLGGTVYNFEVLVKSDSCQDGPISIYNYLNAQPGWPVLIIGDTTVCNVYEYFPGNSPTEADTNSILTRITPRRVNRIENVGSYTYEWRVTYTFTPPPSNVRIGRSYNFGTDVWSVTCDPFLFAPEWSYQPESERLTAECGTFMGFRQQKDAADEVCEIPYIASPETDSDFAVPDKWPHDHGTITPDPPDPNAKGKITTVMNSSQMQYEPPPDKQRPLMRMTVRQYLDPATVSHPLAWDDYLFTLNNADVTLKDPLRADRTVLKRQIMLDRLQIDDQWINGKPVTILTTSLLYRERGWYRAYLNKGVARRSAEGDVDQFGKTITNTDLANNRTNVEKITDMAGRAITDPVPLDLQGKPLDMSAATALRNPWYGYWLLEEERDLVSPPSPLAPVLS